MNAKQEIARRPKTARTILQVMITKAHLDKYHSMPMNSLSEADVQALAWDAIKAWDRLRQDTLKEGDNSSEEDLAKSILADLGPQWQRIIKEHEEEGDHPNA